MNLPANPIRKIRSIRPLDLEDIRGSLGIPDIRSDKFVRALPFSADDVTAGSETELQAAVRGDRNCVDLAVSIASSNYFSNIVRRVSAGDTSKSAICDLEKYLDENSEEIWENSWVRFPMGRVTRYALDILNSDLRSNRGDPVSGVRADLDRFIFEQGNEKWLRIPISYLTKISLADVLGSQENLPEMIRDTGSRIMDNLLSDNTSPETLSFHVVPLTGESGMGRAIAKETSKRFLLTQLLVMYANLAFGLKETGQQALIYFSPHPPMRQKQLNDSISDSFYRELFMNPCLSGWDNGQEKHDYMCLCHQVLSRSQLTAVGKLREAGIITRNLVVLPNVSNICLANNGTHLSIGSLKLSRCLSDTSNMISGSEEKLLGDLVIKIVEHFLPLFVGTYSAAPYRLGFSDFHPEKILGFLPHELDYTHLRMIWRRWKKKASIRVFGQPTTPFGLNTVDRALSLFFGMKGDIIPDFRLIDYMVAPMSTNRSPALDGRIGNQEKLKKDLFDLGIFDTRMSLYMLYRLREHENVGFAGFEGRHYSLFESLEQDMGHAANLQVLITALAFKYALTGIVKHADIPDDPFVESERRQVFFGCAIGIPTFFVHGVTPNKFLRNLLRRTNSVRYSRRYHGYLRVYRRQFLLALVEMIRNDGEELIENLGLRDTIDDLIRRIEHPTSFSATGRITAGILDEMGLASPMEAEAGEFNFAAESYYRTRLKARHLSEAMDLFCEDLNCLDTHGEHHEELYRQAFFNTVGVRDPIRLVESLRSKVLTEEFCVDELRKLIDLLLITLHRDQAMAKKQLRN